MSFQAKRELLVQVAGRYRDVTGHQKSRILAEFVAATGYARKYAIRLLTQPELLPVNPLTRPRLRGADLVAHWGTGAEGSYLYSLVLTDVATGWTECLALLHRSQEAVLQALDIARRLLPFALLGLDTDNGSEFLNQELVAYCEREQITFTRGRAYKKNDQCYVEQKNGSIVRALVGYDRFEGVPTYRQLSELYRAVRLYVND